MRGAGREGSALRLSRLGLGSGRRVTRGARRRVEVESALVVTQGSRDARKGYLPELLDAERVQGHRAVMAGLAQQSTVGAEPDGIDGLRVPGQGQDLTSRGGVP